MRVSNLSGLIGKTPLIAIKYRYKQSERVIYAKAEYLSFTGSIKDRMAFHILWDASINGRLVDGMTIVEATSGNTGISIVAIGRFLGHNVTIFMPDWMSRERIRLLESFGATVRLVSKEEGGFLGSIEMANRLKEDDPNGVFLPLQFDNEMNSNAHYYTTGPEIFKQMRFNGLKPDAFVAGVGTGGTVMGTGRYLREVYPKIKIHPLQPSNSPILTLGYNTGKHRIQGISDEFIPSIVNLSLLDSVVSVDDGDAIIMSQMLAKNLGLGVGISSGANFLGAVHLQNQGYDNYSVVTVFPDDNKKYLSTDYLTSEPSQDHFLTNDIELLDLTTVL